MVQNNRHNNSQEVRLTQIVLDLEQNGESNMTLFGDIALEWSNQLYKESNKHVNKSSQIRSFYDKVIGFYEKSVDMNDDEYKKKVYPYAVVLKSKVAYAKTRNLVSQSFVNMINQCIQEATTVTKMENFKYFFEAVIGFYPKK